MSCFYFVDILNQMMSLQYPLMTLKVYFNMNGKDQVKCFTFNQSQ